MPADVASLLKSARQSLTDAGCETPALDARLLLQEAAGLGHDAIIAFPETSVPEEARRRFETFIARRAAREPVSRIIGWREFYGRRFRITPDVLDPRPDTETLIEAALPLVQHGGRVLDLGVGSGAIIVTLLAECSGLQGMAVDLSDAALAVAAENARLNGVDERLDLRQGSWCAPVSGQFSLIVTNPPYIPAADVTQLAPDVRDHDPHLALAGGTDGLEAYRAIAAQAARHLEPGGRVIVEIGAGQADDVTKLFVANGYSPAGRFADLGGHVRCLAFALAA